LVSERITDLSKSSAAMAGLSKAPSFLRPNETVSHRKSLQKALFQKPLVVLDFFVLWPELHFANPFFKSRALI
jgi:hypothetical protein